MAFSACEMSTKRVLTNKGDMQNIQDVGVKPSRKTSNNVCILFQKEIANIPTSDVNKNFSKTKTSNSKTKTARLHHMT